MTFFAFLPDEEAGGADRDAETDQHEPQPNCDRQVSLAGLQHNGGCHRSGIAGDVTTDDQDRADLGDRAAEAGEDSGQDRRSRDHQQHSDGARAARTVHAQGVAIFAPRPLHRPVSQGADDRRRQRRLRQDHAARGEQEAEPSERP